MEKLFFEVREVHQAASGGSHVVKYSAEMEVLDGSRPFAVEMVSVYPPDLFSSEATEIGRQGIERGAVRAFEGTGKAARIRVRDFVIHLGDWKPGYVEEYTFRAVRRVLGGAC
jgi:hypothetical protein